MIFNVVCMCECDTSAIIILSHPFLLLQKRRERERRVCENFFVPRLRSDLLTITHTQKKERKRKREREQVEKRKNNHQGKEEREEKREKRETKQHLVLTKLQQRVVKPKHSVVLLNKESFILKQMQKS